MPALKKIGAAALAAFGWTSGGAAAVTASYLQVAGGGGGGGGAGQSNGAGGGGAGGYLTGTTSLNPTLSYTVVVGAGGAGGSTSVYNSTGTSGSNSSITGLTASVGGGGAGGTNGTGGVGNGQSGGSGGGGNSAGTGGTATSGQGNNGGGSVTTGPNYGGGGGGGASAVGATGTTTAGGNGGNGSASSISGSSVTYAGGGGAGTYNGGTVGTGGTGGGGNAGANTGANGSNGNANLGGGGGGASFNLSPSAPFSGGQGGSGIVIISYAGAQQFGGGVVTSVGGNTIHTFLTSGTLSPLSSLSASYLIVAGGGGGGGPQGGGGGAGGLLSGSGVTIDTNSTYLVTVGAGGAGGPTSQFSPTDGFTGSNSAFGLVSTTALGGGGAGGNGAVGKTGGSGGGGGSQVGIAGNGGSGTSGQGNAGGNASVSNAGGGGGGSGSVGAAAVATTGGNGGTGTSSSISGTATFYASGGGGGTNGTTAGTASAGGGVNGSNTYTVTPAGATANLGGGGGGGGGGGTYGGAGGNGGSGIVIISYAGATQQMAGGSVTITGGNVIHTFTSSGYLTPLTYYSNSLRFRSSVSAYLSRTPTRTSTQRTWTWSGWVKRGSLASLNQVFTWYNANFNYIGAFRFEANDTLNIYEFNIGASSYIWQVQTTQVFRDPAAWYHIVVAYDSTQATAANRLIIYVNGVAVSSYAATNYPTLNYQSSLNTANYPNYFGAGYNGTTFTQYYDGYLSNVNFIDGQALTPNSFGTFNSYGVWQPINYGGSYGTNGFYLPFNSVATSSYAAEYSGSNYIISPSGVNYNVSGDYTFETWVYFAGNPNNNVSKFIFDHRSSTGAGGITLVQESSDNTWTAWNASNVFVGNTIVAGRWYHMAISRQSGTQRVFLNGILTNTTADASTYNTDQVSLGTRYSGTNSLPSGAYLSNLRFVVGTALYTTNFTPSTTPLTAVTNTKLLTFQNSTIIDNSGLSNTLTNTGSLATTVQYPFSINVFNDQSPQGNNWTPNNFSLLNGSNYDSMTDVPTLTSATASNFAVMNPVYLTASNTTNNGNLGFTALPAANSNVLSTMAISSGSWYMELTMTATTGNGGAGFGPTTTNYYSTRILTGGSGYGCYFTGQVVAAGVLGATYTAFTTAGDIMMLAFDATNGKLFVGRNGTWFNSGNPAAGTGAVLTGIPANTYYFGIEGGGVANITGNMNFGQRPFRYTPPSGFVALNTFNL